jgi:hypothetical protein
MSNRLLTLAGASLVICLGVCGAGAAERPVHWKHAPSLLQPLEGRAALLDGDIAQSPIIGRGADRGYSMYFSPQQDEEYRGRF